MLILTQNPTQVNKLETDLCGDHKHFHQKQCADQKFIWNNRTEFGMVAS